MNAGTGRAKIRGAHRAPTQHLRRRAIGTLFRAGLRTALPPLHDMRELVREQALPACSLRLVFAAAEDDVGSARIGTCVERSRGSRRRIAGVDPYAAEVMAEAGLHRAAQSGVERPGAALARQRRDVRRLACRRVQCCGVARAAHRFSAPSMPRAAALPSAAPLTPLTRSGSVRSFAR